MDGVVYDCKERVDKLENTMHNCQSSPMKAVCVDKVNQMVEDKINSQYRILSLETKNVILELKEELRELIKAAIIEASTSNKEKINWVLEAVRYAIMVGMFIIAIKVKIG